MRILSLLFHILAATVVVSALSSTANPTKVLVTGASGKTGRLVFEALQENPNFDPKALVRSDKSAKSLRKAVPGTRLEQIVVCDITHLTDEGGLPDGLDGRCESMVICTSAMPLISKGSLLKAVLKAPFNIIRGKKAVDFRSLKFVWKKGQYPEKVRCVGELHAHLVSFRPSFAHHPCIWKVDYEGQVAQIDMAKKIGINHVVVVGSMGGTDPNNFLNAVGKNADGSGHGDILLWKRRAEKYLVDSGLDYTIIHPGGLTDTPVGEEEYVLDVNDNLLKNKKRSISRGDVANLCVAALSIGKGKRIALDCITQPRDYDDDDDESQEPIKTAEEVLEEFLQESKVYNYAL